MLELEIGVAVPPSAADADAVVLAEVSIAPHSGGIFQKKPLVMLLGNDIDNSGYGITAIQCGRGTFDNFYLVYDLSAGDHCLRLHLR